MVLWTAGFVLLTLIINAPLLPWVLRVTGLNKGVLYSSTHHMHDVQISVVIHYGNDC